MVMRISQTTEEFLPVKIQLFALLYAQTQKFHVYAGIKNGADY